MPNYLVTSPDGRKLKITGDAPPTESELEEIFSQTSQSLLKTSSGGDAISQRVQSPLGPMLDFGVGGLPATGFQLGAQIGSPLHEPLSQMPAAAIRSGLTGGGYAEGALNPENVPYFKEMLQQRAGQGGNRFLSDLLSQENFATAGPVSAPIGTAASLADRATNPLDLLLMFAGPRGGRAAVRGGAKAPTTGPANPAQKGFLRGQALQKQKQLTTSVLQPSKQELASYLVRGRQMPAVEQASRVIKKSKNYTELRENIDAVIQKTFTRRNQLLAENNKPIGTDYLKDLESLIARESAKGQAKRSDISVMREVLENEKAYLGMTSPRSITGGFVIPEGAVTKSVTPRLARSARETKGGFVIPKGAKSTSIKPEIVKGEKVVGVPNQMGGTVEERIRFAHRIQREGTISRPEELSGGPPVRPTAKSIVQEQRIANRPEQLAGGPEVKSNIRNLDVLQGQKRKELLQDLTNRLLERREGGELVDLDPARNRALDALRKGLRKSIEGAHPEIKELNSTYGGLLRAKELVAGQEALSGKVLPKSFLENIANSVVRFVTSGRANPAVHVMDAAASRSKGLSSLTGEIEKLQSLISKLG